MHHWTKRLFALAAPLLLTGCLWGPGRFASQLTLNRNGTFVLDYRGEIVMQLPPDADKAEPWRDDMAACSTSDGKEMQKTPCTPEQIASRKPTMKKGAPTSARKMRRWRRLSAFPGWTMNPTGPSRPS